VEKDNIVAVSRDTSTGIFITTTDKNLRREWIIPPCIPMICLARESRGIKWAVPSGVCHLTPIPMAR
jgi:hypothetical protein